MCLTLEYRVWLVCTCASSPIRRAKSQGSSCAAAGSESMQAASAILARRPAPEIMEVEPVVGRRAAEILQALGVALGPLSRPRGPLGALRVRLLAHGLQVNDLALAAAVQARHPIHRDAHAQGEAQR